jgi:hypothetical protein
MGVMLPALLALSSVGAVSKNQPRPTPPSLDPLRDIKPPIEVSSDWIWVALAAAGLLAAAAAWLAWYYWRRKRRVPPPQAPTVPAHIRAKEKLQQALGLIAQPNPFCTFVSDTIRVYLEERFELHAPERTTEEFLHELRSSHLLLPDQKNSLGDFLQRCDLVKFAKYEPAEIELRNLHDSALRLVDETAPVAPGFAEQQNPNVMRAP